MPRLFELILVLFVFLGANVYVFYRLYMMLPPILPLKVLLILSGICIQLPFFVALLFGNSFSTSLTSILYKTGTVWIVIFVYLLLIFIICDIVQFTHLFDIKKFMSNSYVGWLFLLVVISVTLILGNINYYKKSRVELNIKLEKKMKTPLKILAVSDFHLGYGIDKNELETWVQLINSEKPDIVFIAGDVVDNFLKPLEEQKIYKTLRKINSKYGVYMALGNHEYIGDINQNIEFLEKSNIKVLRDSVELVNNEFYVIGREDASRKYRLKLNCILEKLDTLKPLFVIDHQPIMLDESITNGVDFQICGHTHDGQFFPINLIAKLLFKQSYGYIKYSNTNIYVTSGIGIWGGKFRIGTKSEYVVVNLY
jgi:predicted MPP superfamily phosphohydrolase